MQEARNKVMLKSFPCLSLSRLEAWLRSLTKSCLCCWPASKHETGWRNRRTNARKWRRSPGKAIPPLQFLQAYCWRRIRPAGGWDIALRIPEPKLRQQCFKYHEYRPERARSMHQSLALHVFNDTKLCGSTKRSRFVLLRLPASTAP